MHDVLMITYRRAAFTRLSLTRLLETCDEQMRVWVWHNGTDAETIRVVKGFHGHPRLHHVEFSEVNKRLTEPTNWFWQNARGDYLSKVDDDCLVPQDWGRTLRTALEDEPRFGIVGCWRFYPEDFDESLAGPKIRTFQKGHQLMVHGFTQGSGYLMRRSVLEHCGLLKRKESFTTYCLRAAKAGWINGWYFPFLHEDHMDDARSPNYPYSSEEEFQQNLSLSQINFGIRSLSDWQNFSRLQARHLQADRVNPANFFGIRGFARRVLRRIRPQRRFWERKL